MAQNYLREISADRQWDIMCAVINRDGVDDEKIIQMVQDGYSVDLAFCELLYRLGRNDLIKQLVAYDENLYYEWYVCSQKMLFLEKFLGKEEAHKLRQELIDAHQKEIDEKKRKEKEEKLIQLKELYSSFGLDDYFYKQLIKADLLSVALEHFEDNYKVKRSIILEIAKRNSRYLYRKTSFEDFFQCGVFDLLLKGLTLVSKNEQIFWLNKIVQSDEGLLALMNSWLSEVHVKLVEKEKLVDIEKLKERVKKFGEKGYRYLLDTNQLTEKDFEEYCKIKPEISKIYFRFNKSVFWMIKNGYFKYLYFKYL